MVYTQINICNILHSHIFFMYCVMRPCEWVLTGEMVGGRSAMEEGMGWDQWGF